MSKIDFVHVGQNALFFFFLLLFTNDNFLEFEYLRHFQNKIFRGICVGLGNTENILSRL